MNSKIIISLLFSILLIITLSSCLTSPPPQLVLNTEDGELLLEGSREFPPLEREKGDESLPEEGFFYPLPPEISNSKTGSLIKVLYPAEYSGWVDFYLSDGSIKRAEIRPEGKRENPVIRILSSFTMKQLKGIGIPESKDAPVPQISLESERLVSNTETSIETEGITIIQKGKEEWVIELAPSIFHPVLTENPWYIKLDYLQESTETPNQTGNSSLSLIHENGESEEFDFYPKTGSHSLYFYSEQYNRMPEEFRVNGVEDFSITAVSVNLRTDEEGKAVPIIADTGTILHYPREFWRNPHYEYFRWNMYPEIVQIITDTYENQSLFFKRLAFYVEKPGFVGRLAPNEEIKPLHGWNAHDYRPEDLANFFQQARIENFKLNPEEELLQELLLACGVLLDSAGTLLPGKGALIGTSIETFYEQRLIFMAHESLHGIYFTSEEYRKECEAFWDTLSADEQKFWRNFLSYRGYNVDEDHDLLINETCTYLLQQPPDQADDYFVGFITPRLLSSRTWLKDWLTPFLLDNQGLFADEVRRMEERLYRLAGFTAATIHDLLPKDRSKWFIFEGMEKKWLEQQNS
ncbi:MAG: hypothetical protein JEY99_18165 [Spirochaetales bacterium]|nr:hypothetical protein [Spirochaetales bacterium]